MSPHCSSSWEKRGASVSSPTAFSDFQKLVAILGDIFRTSPVPLREVRLALATKRILDGEPPAAVAASYRLQLRALTTSAAAVKEHGLAALSPEYRVVTAESLGRRRLGIAQMLLGALAEKRFEEISSEVLGTGVLRIEDHRPSRTDTDYRLLNGQGSPLCRLNIKFHGTLFRDARRYVGLDPEDCFALAPCKINNALKRQRLEELPYVFLVFSVPEISAAEVGELIPEELVWCLDVLEGRRIVEEAIVDRLRASGFPERFAPIIRKMPEGKFRVISATKADSLMRAKLFERVHALSLKGFTRRFRNAEVDMHFSLSNELTPIRTFFAALVKESTQRFAIQLYAGKY